MKKMIKKSTISFLVVFVLSAVFVAGTYLGAQAYSGTVFGRKQGYGYFYNKKVSGSSSSSGYVIKNGVKNKDSVKELISFLKDKNKKEDSQDGTGAAFIVYTLLGKDGKKRDKDIDGDDWDELEARLKSLDARGNIKWSKTVSLSINSYHQEYEDKDGDEVHDDAFYSKNSSEKSIVFYDDDDDIIYAIAHKCANPMGNKGEFEGLPEPNEWEVSTKSSLVSAPVTPGQTITWKHTVKNDGPDETDTDVDYRYQNRDGLGNGTGSNHEFSSGADKGDDESFNSTHTITQSNVGNNLCRSTSASPEAWDDDGWTESSRACVFIPYNYNITPHITANVSGAVEANTSFSVTPYVTNTGPTKTRDTQWQITLMVVQPGADIPHETGGNSGESPCGTYYQAPNATCSNVSSGNTVFSETGARLTGSMIAATSVTAGDYEVGTHICYAFSVQPRSSSNNQWAHSAPVCLVIGKKPKVQVWGNDLSAGGIVRGSTSVKNISGTNRTFGSWVEYGVFAEGIISGVASGSAFAGPGFNSTDFCRYSRLSFTSSGTSTCTPSTVLGSYQLSRTIPDIASSFPVNAADLSRDLGDDITIDLSNDSLQGVYTAGGSITINGGDAGQFINRGQWIVINAPESTVTINGDIRYTSEVLNEINDIPQVVIIANNINITSAVNNIDAWLIASANINTCSSVGINSPLSSSICNNQLTVNGPVISQKLYLRRTAGSGTGDHSGDPAEVFNLRPDAYLWSVSRANASGQIQTVDTTELPPRF